MSVIQITLDKPATPTQISGLYKKISKAVSQDPNPPEIFITAKLAQRAPRGVETTTDGG